MITGAAFCPHPPSLVPQVARGAAPELEALRAACRTAIRRIAAPGARLVVLGSAAESGRYPASARGSFAGYGVDVEVTLGGAAAGPAVLPLSLAVGAWLLRDALGVDATADGIAVAAGGPTPDLDPEPVALVVMGDGSARRSLTAPGYLDERAEGYDAQVATALAGGRPEALAVDAALGTDLLAAGVPAWRVAADLLDGGPGYDAELLYDAAPYGVGYLVAVWSAHG